MIAQFPRLLILEYKNTIDLNIIKLGPAGAKGELELNNHFDRY